MRFRVLALVGVMVVGGAAARQADAAPILGASVFATGGHVLATFESNGAGYTNDLYLDSPANALGLLFRNSTTAPGTTIDLGDFAAGTELIFRVFVNNTGDNFYTGPAARNADGIAHVMVDDNVAGFPGRTFVGFEDLLGGGDFDYNDLVFSFTNVSHKRDVPEPTDLLLFGAGLALVAARMRRHFAASAATR